MIQLLTNIFSHVQWRDLMHAILLLDMDLVLLIF